MLKHTNLLRDKGQFLGFYFQIHKPKESQFTLMRKGGHIRKSKISQNRMWLLIPVDKLLAKLSAEGFLKNYAHGKKIIPSSLACLHKQKKNKLDIYKSPGHSISIQLADKRTT